MGLVSPLKCTVEILVNSKVPSQTYETSDRAPYELGLAPVRSRYLVDDHFRDSLLQVWDSNELQRLESFSQHYGRDGALSVESATRFAL